MIDHMPEPPGKPWTWEIDTLLDTLGVDPEKGLSRADVKKRRSQHGSNRIKQQSRKSAWIVLLNQFESVIVLLLSAAAVATFVVGRWVEGIAIAVVVVFNSMLGFFTELRAVRSMEALEKLSHSMTRVQRQGRHEKVPSHELVPGDIVIVEAGDTVSADMRLIESARIETNESTLTGESMPVPKLTGPLAADTLLAERYCMLYNGTAVTRGSGEAVVVATGMDTELGRIASGIQEAGEDHTPLEKRLDQLGRAFIWLTVILSAIIIGVGLLAGRDIVLVVETAIALAIAAIPEGMPIVATIALARGMRRMARRNALVNRLSSVETLGSATIIATDKTGTLTENQMTASRIILPEMEIEISGEGLKRQGKFLAGETVVDPAENELLELLLRTGALCGNASLHSNEEDEAAALGDPMEVALLIAAEKAGMHKNELLEQYPEEYEVSFAPDTHMMATIHKSGDDYLYAVKGAPEKVLANCSRLAGDRGGALDERRRVELLDRSRELAGRGLRILALAMKESSRSGEEAYADLALLGLVCFLDPPREEVKAAITAAHRAGIRTVMVTGDQLATARAVAAHLEMATDTLEAMEGRELKKFDQMSESEKQQVLESTVFARVSPEQKLDLVDLYQQENNIVAMTGDGVNDAPALEKADIGVAMGRRGTQVAREAADMILKDDSFSTIVAAIEEGRIIFGNIRQFILFLLTISLSMILTVFFGSLLDMPLPILPLQVLYLNAVTHVFPALALGMGEGHESIMDEPPRQPDRPIMERGDWIFITFFAALIGLVTLAGLYFAFHFLGRSPSQSQDISFLIIALAQLLHVFNVRRGGSGVFVNDVTRNRYVWIAVAASIILTLIILYVPILAAVMSIEPPGPVEWLVALGFSLVQLAIGQVYINVRQARRRQPGGK